MSLLRLPVISALLIGFTSLAFAGMSLSPPQVSPRPIVDSSQNSRSLDPHAFALAARHIAALLGIETAVLARRYTALSRIDSNDVTGSQSGSETTLVNN
jgi:hypothetical protein